MAAAKGKQTEPAADSTKQPQVDVDALNAEIEKVSGELATSKGLIEELDNALAMSKEALTKTGEALAETQSELALAKEEIESLKDTPAADPDFVPVPVKKAYKVLKNCFWENARRRAGETVMAYFENEKDKPSYFKLKTARVSDDDEAGEAERTDSHIGAGMVKKVGSASDVDIK